MVVDKHPGEEISTSMMINQKYTSYHNSNVSTEKILYRNFQA
jgi:hypothetical protein